MMKNAFYFISKALFVLKIFTFRHDFWSCRKKDLIRKIRLTSKFMTSQSGSQTIGISIQPNISKDNLTMKFGPLIEYNTRNIFLQKLCGK